MSGKRLPAGSSTEIVAMIREGLPYSEIADAFGCTTGTVTYYAVRAGLARHRAAKPDSEGPATRLPHDMPRGIPFEAQPWADRAVCTQTDPDSFFPDKGGSTREAKAVCATCTVAAECLDWALAHDEKFGIWGGLSERERRRLKKQLEEPA